MRKKSSPKSPEQVCEDHGLSPFGRQRIVVSEEGIQTAASRKTPDSVILDQGIYTTIVDLRPPEFLMPDASQIDQRRLWIEELCGIADRAKEILKIHAVAHTPNPELVPDNYCGTFDLGDGPRPYSLSADAPLEVRDAAAVLWYIEQVKEFQTIREAYCFWLGMTSERMQVGKFGSLVLSAKKSRAGSRKIAGRRRTRTLKRQAELSAQVAALMASSKRLNKSAVVARVAAKNKCSEDTVWRAVKAGK